MSQEERRKRPEASQYHGRRHQMCDYRSMQSAGHPRNIPYHHGQQPNPYWLNRNHQNHSPFSSPRHFYPMRQVFVQHGPFGNGGNRFLPAPLPHFPNPVHFPPHVPPTNYNNEHRRNRNHSENDHMNEVHRFYHNNHGRNFGHDRFSRYEMGQGARPKTYSPRFFKDKNRSARKKKHHNVQSNTPSSFPVENSTLKGSENVSQGPDVKFEPAQKDGRNLTDEDNSTFKEKSHKNSVPVLSDSETEGAVGGVACVEVPFVVGLQCGDQVADPSVYDKNLIDEGAICDLDSMFRSQEFLGTIEDHKNLYLSDDNEDNGCDNIESVQNLDSLLKPSSNIFLGDDSDIENQAVSMSCTLKPQNMSSPSLCMPSKSFPSPQKDPSSGDIVNDPRGNEVEDGEDTGDFIDTDLPAQCLLSSSDEMENESSSDQEEEPLFLSNDCVSENFSDINSNDILNPASNALAEALDDIKMKTSKIQLSCSPTIPSSQSNGLKSSAKYKRQKRQCNTCEFNGHNVNSSDSENDENHKVSIPPSFLPKAHASALNYFHPGDFYSDGAAASQVVMEVNQVPQSRAGKSNIPLHSPHLPTSPPGAGCEMPLPPDQCFLSVGAIPAPSDVSVGQEGPGPSVVTAECEPNLADACSFSQHPEPSCSTTASGGACHQQFQAMDDFSACCQNNMVDGPCSTKELAADGSSPEDPSLSHDSNDNIDMVLLPMEEEIEPVLRMGSILCSGSGAGIYDSDVGSAGFSSPTVQPGSVSSLYEDHEGRYPIDQGHLRGAVPSKEFYELIKTVSTTDSYMRFYDKDGHDVQRERVSGSDDEQNHEDSSKAERLRVDRVMIWNEYEAYVMQFKQIAVSACGQTAVLNVLKALKIPCEKSAVCKVIQGSLRKEDADIPEYLFSRAVAGTTAEELTSGIETLSGGAVGGRFFPFWPSRKVKLLQWLAYWMKRGAIPMATLNLQQGPHLVWQVPDSWHHQMVYGVSHQGLYLTNPLEIVSERSAMKQLCSDSVLMIRRQDIISRFRKTTDLGELLGHSDPRWCTMNVLGQVVNVLREFNMPSVPGYRLQVTSHISIPACYKAGITLFMRKDKAAWTTLLNAPDLPVDSQSPKPNSQSQQCVAGAEAL
ncbi:pyroglutamyl-peptidase 1 [Elysia marginata]|uniref:Pyroglutamyl-peptidase 1 n=1 Tax=Elysia marginata TaxID=1093978 RepID=A0AAV4EGB3_9GAST|nr:pyroglutamyl-peptidase 1 [Elysia marginata]